MSPHGSESKKVCRLHCFTSSGSSDFTTRSLQNLWWSFSKWSPKRGGYVLSKCGHGWFGRVWLSRTWSSPQWLMHKYGFDKKKLWCSTNYILKNQSVLVLHLPSRVLSRPSMTYYDWRSHWTIFNIHECTDTCSRIPCNLFNPECNLLNHFVFVGASQSILDGILQGSMENIIH